MRAANKPWRAPRCELILRVEYESAGQLRADYLTNLSCGGLFLQTELPLAVEQTLEMTLALPLPFEPIKVQGQVRWKNTAGDFTIRGVGVAFTNLDPAAKAKIDQLLATADPATICPTEVVHSEAEHGPNAILRVVLLEKNEVLQGIFSYAGKFIKSKLGPGNWNADVACVTDGQGCLAALKAKPTNLLVLDLDCLPYPTQFVAEVLGENGQSHLTIIGLTGRPSAVDLSNSRLMILPKPIALEPLFRTLSILLLAKVSPIESLARSTPR